MIFLALGSNLKSRFGDRFKNINLAISYLQEHDIEIIKKSSFYETPSYPDMTNPRFINVVISIKTELSPDQLISILILIENRLGRKRIVKNDPRTCDIDIIDYKNMILNFKYKNSNYIIPHEKINSRNFVLFPLREISPLWRHPKTKEKIDILIDKLSKDDKISILKIEKN